MCQGCGGQEVRRSWSDRTRARHHTAPKVRLGVSNSRMGHGLFVVRPVSRQPVPILVEGLPKGGNVSMAEYGEHTAKERNDPVAAGIFNSYTQSGQIADQRLRGGQPHRAAPGQSGGFRNSHCFTHNAHSSGDWLLAESRASIEFIVGARLRWTSSTLSSCFFRLNDLILLTRRVESRPDVARSALYRPLFGVGSSCPVQR